MKATRKRPELVGVLKDACFVLEFCILAGRETRVLDLPCDVPQVVRPFFRFGTSRRKSGNLASESGELSVSASHKVRL